MSRTPCRARSICQRPRIQAASSPGRAHRARGGSLKPQIRCHGRVPGPTGSIVSYRIIRRRVNIRVKVHERAESRPSLYLDTCDLFCLVRSSELGPGSCDFTEAVYQAVSFAAHPHGVVESGGRSGWTAVSPIMTLQSTRRTRNYWIASGGMDRVRVKLILGAVRWLWWVRSCAVHRRSSTSCGTTRSPTIPRSAGWPGQGGPDIAVTAAGGVDVDGNPDVHSLKRRGWQRSGALQVLFTRLAQPGAELLSAPDHLICPATRRARALSHRAVAGAGGNNSAHRASLIRRHPHRHFIRFVGRYRLRHM